ncbi:hypothetical protein QBC46DRAFT_358550 [Diplogelasinospora grovesii]|uniref:Zn(2)-C6 fungal-type domain-containing protein n=1 Tax=Diplogelasinospora grovesii TaxID=303347 RepID=A0AAN6RZP0_9PEZI|nr:hypothetical protein QBC46DRAFT_358550 [Diplogelasinospora grovesii]
MARLLICRNCRKTLQPIRTRVACTFCRGRKIKCIRLGNRPCEECLLLGNDCDYSNTRATVPSRPDDIASSGANVDSPRDVHATDLFTPNDVVQIPEQTGFPLDMRAQQSHPNQSMAAVQTPMKSPASFSAESANMSGSEYRRDSIANIEPLRLS